MSGIFDYNLFGESEGLGVLPTGAQPIAQIEQYRGRFPRLLTLAALRTGGVTHFATTPPGPGQSQQSFLYLGATGVRKGDQLLAVPQSELPSGPVDPEKGYNPYPGLAPVPGDGLLPSQLDEAPGSGSPRWLPFALVGGGVALAAGIVLVATRRPARAPTPNRRRKRRRSSRPRR